MKFLSYIFSLFSSIPNLDDIPDEVFVPLTLREDIKSLYKLGDQSAIHKDETGKFIGILVNFGKTFKYPNSTKEECVVLVKELGKINGQLMFFLVNELLWNNNKDYHNIINRYVEVTFPRIDKIKEDLAKRFNITEQDTEDYGCSIS